MIDNEVGFQIIAPLILSVLMIFVFLDLLNSIGPPPQRHRTKADDAERELFLKTYQYKSRQRHDGKERMTYSDRFSKLALSDFAELASRIAQVAAQWSADTLGSHDNLDSPMLHDSVRQFAEEITTRVHRITERARG